MVDFQVKCVKTVTDEGTWEKTFTRGNIYDVEVVGDTWFTRDDGHNKVTIETSQTTDWLASNFVKI